MANVPTIYLVTDMRTVPDSQTGGYACITNTTQHQSRNGAEERYHTALAAAARNTQYPLMAAVMMTNEGFVIESKSYAHEVVPSEPEPEDNGETEGE